MHLFFQNTEVIVPEAGCLVNSAYRAPPARKISLKGVLRLWHISTTRNWKPGRLGSFVADLKTWLGKGTKPLVSHLGKELWVMRDLNKQTGRYLVWKQELKYWQVVKFPSSQPVLFSCMEVVLEGEAAGNMHLKTEGKIRRLMEDAELMTKVFNKTVTLFTF